MRGTLPPTLVEPDAGLSAVLGDWLGWAWAAWHEFSLARRWLLAAGSILKRHAKGGKTDSEPSRPRVRKLIPYFVGWLAGWAFGIRGNPL